MTPDAQMGEATAAWYRLDRPGDADGAVVAGYVAALRVLRRIDPHAIPVQDAAVRSAMSRVDIEAVERWLDDTWGDITGTLVEVVVA